MSFTSSLTKKEAFAVLLYLPVHLLLLPNLLIYLAGKYQLDTPVINFMQYAAGAVYMLLTLRSFLRREFDALCDRPMKTVFLLLGGYMATFFFTAVAGLLLQLILPGSNRNNAAVAEMAERSRGLTVAAAVFLAPLVEEPIFRAGIFGVIRKKSRTAAYIMGALTFSLYHVISYAALNPLYLVYALQYIPASLILIICYERSDTLWTPIFLHMLINGVSMSQLGSIK